MWLPIDVVVVVVVVVVAIGVDDVDGFDAVVICAVVGVA